ncbi:SMC-Scp complex subunit ScpB [Candidatus Uhrbacteria bacterium RIFCSPHIGHO2_02_FULL_60_10]|uniref:SMC-Scp complex subunit ScpB n=1 Tax=Candidatus Uhrbacteria bacterium RIFCSPHIGHO2_02_FULL_60_10 TaxID=1802392 RepID=A0A1F7U9Y8_9BACT|nr:MAG: SMC-Scp complex subunit ScpB [Candidatus Uhrbacteria bacterium RIFCSPHIGHO2_02_FULL_60_10]
MLSAQIESILFVTNRPLSVKKIAETVGADRTEVSKALDEIAAAYNTEGRGVRLLRHGDDVQLSTAPEASALVQAYLKDETTGELTKPSLETLTIVAYRGPVSKAELEQIRGVNCSLILRNLMMRGLVESVGEVGKPETRYRVTMDFLRFLGVAGVEELPDYEKLRSHENIVRVLAMANTPPAVNAASVEEPAPVAANAATAADGTR